MSHKYTIRTGSLMAFIAIGTAAQSNPGPGWAVLAQLAHTLWTDGFAIAQSVLQHGLEGMAIVLRGPWGAL